VSIVWTYFATNSPKCKMSRKLGHLVPGSMGGANGRRDRKTRRRMDKSRNANIHFCKFTNAHKYVYFTFLIIYAQYEIRLFWGTDNGAWNFNARWHIYSSFYYYAVLTSFNHQQLFQFRFYRHTQAETFTNFCYLTYVRRTEIIITQACILRAIKNCLHHFSCF